MACRLMGVYNIQDEDGNPPSSISTPSFWHPKRGLMLNANGKMNFVTLDALFQPIGTPLGANFDSLGWDAEGRKLLSLTGIGVSGTGTLYSLEPYAMVRFLDTENLGFMGTNFIRYKGDYYLSGSNAVQKKDLIGGFASSVSPSLGFSGRIGAGRNDDEVFVGESTNNPRGRFYNLATGEMSATYYCTGTSSVLVYAPEHEVMVAVDFTNKVFRIFSLEVEPASVSAPALLSGSVAAGATAIFRTQVLGSNSDPCEGELVDWSITGAGTLVESQSETDSSGYATARVTYGLGDGTLSTEITASVRC